MDRRVNPRLENGWRHPGLFKLCLCLGDMRSCLVNVVVGVQTKKKERENYQFLNAVASERFLCECEIHD